MPLELAGTEVLAAGAIAIAAVDRTIGLGFKRELGDSDTALGAFETHGGNVDHLARSEAALLIESHSVLLPRVNAVLS